MELRDSPEARVIAAYSQFIGDVAAVAAGGKPEQSDVSPLVEVRDRRAVIAQMCRAASQREFAIVVPGTHLPAPAAAGRRGRHRARASSITNARLLAILAGLGKPFLAQTRMMRARILSALLIAFEDQKHVPTMPQLDEEMRTSVVDTIRGRLENKLRDVRIRGNTFAHNRFKARRGYDSRIGMMTGPRAGSLHASLSGLRLLYGRTP